MNKKRNTPLIFLMVNMFIAMLGFGLIIPILPDFLKEFGAGGGVAGYLVAAFGLSQFVFSPIAGDWSDKYGRKKMIVGGLLLFSLGNLIFALAETIPMLYVARLVGGIGAAAMIPSMMAYVADITTQEDRGKGMGMLGAAMSFGFVVGPGLGGILAEFGLRMPFYISGAVGALAMLGSLVILPESRSQEDQRASRESKVKKENILKQFAQSFKAPYFLLLFLIFSLTFGLANFEAIFPLFVNEMYGFNTREISILITVGAVIGTVVQGVFIGKLITAFGEKRLINITFLLSAAALILMLLSGNFWYILILVSLFFSFTSVMRPAINTLLSKMAGNEQGFVAGMNNAYMSIGNIFGPAMAGLLFDVNVTFPNILGAIVLMLSLFLSMANGAKLKALKPETSI
ncbi:multidrug transporter [Paenibacillus swuensis]|uniref:Multidrug transporter n=1 Tax=Paenibacillus swuensis TaxID=1178515 RepID=A0A172TDE5_9BACL|nr:MFS transporter [Paenibacillus swuensis]ANE45059.1 multidrug transporter [Paenibacillus swuensis]